eukprot:jgi/Psemu1/189750/e_gw1.93.129.1
MDRRSAIHQAGVAAAAFGTMSASGLLLPNSPQLARAAGTDTINPIATLADGSKFPLASFGLHVLAGNQKGFAKAIKDSNVPREDLYICGSVVSNRVSGFENAKQATTKGWKRNMEAFGVGGIDYLDQIMLDYPGPDCESIQGQWKAFEEMHDQKLTRSISVSNFSSKQLDCVLEKAAVKPVVNQLPYSVAYHPGNSIAENNKRGILVQAWAPLGGSLGGRFDKSIKKPCAQIGKKYNKSFAQVALRWIVQSGGSFTTQSKNKDHFSEDLNIFDFELTDEEMNTLNSLA